MNNEERNLVPYGEGREVGFPDRQWGPPIEGEYREVPSEEAVPGWFPPEGPIEGGRMPPAEERPWEKEAEKRTDRAMRGAIEEEDLINELRIKAISLGGDPRYIDRLSSVEALKAYINRLEEEGFKYGREKWRFGQEKGKAKREILERVGGRIKKTLLPGKGRTAIYFPGRSLITGTSGLKMSPAGKALIPGGKEGVPIARTGYDYGSLRQAGAFTQGGFPKPMPNLEALKDPFLQNVNLTTISNSISKLPKSWSRPMMFAYAEIKANHDTDTTTNVKKDLAAFQIKSPQVDQALNKLRSLGFIKLQRSPVGGESEWIITDRIP